MEPADLADAARRSQRYWDVDGLPELVMGALWVVWGAAWLFGQTLERGWTYNAYWMFTPAFLAGSGVIAVWLIKRLKARFTFPRTGYVEWKKPSRPQRVATAAVALVAAAVLTGVIAAHGRPAAENAAPVLGVILSLGFVVVSLRMRAPHHLALAAVAVALGLALGATGGRWDSVNWLFVYLGAASAAFGAVRFAMFLRHHPRAGVELS
jgi:hypothetical protein